MLWGWLWTVPSARHCTGTVLWGICGLYNWAAWQVSPTQSLTPPQTPQHVLKGLSASLRVCTSVVRQGYNIITNRGVTAKLASHAGTLYCRVLPHEEAVTSVYRICLEKSVFMKHYPPDWETESFSGAARLYWAAQGTFNEDVISQGGFFWLDTRAWCGESGECWAHFLISAPPCGRCLGEVLENGVCAWMGPQCYMAPGVLSSWSCAWEMGRGSKALSVPSFPDKSTPCSGLFLGVIFWVISCSCTICLNLQMKQYLKEIGAVSIHLCSV